MLRSQPAAPILRIFLEGFGTRRQAEETMKRENKRQLKPRGTTFCVHVASRHTRGSSVYVVGHLGTQEESGS